VQPEWLVNWTELFIGNLEEYAVFAIDLSGTILTWQPGVRQVLGYERDAFVGRHTDAIFTDSDRRVGAPAGELKTAVQTGQATDKRWHVRADGSRFWGSGIMIALPDGNGETVGLAKIVRDRTVLRLEGELQGLRTLRLEGDVASRTRQVQALAADLTLAEQRERQRISQLLHDELQQQLYALQMLLHGAQAQAGESGKEELYKTLAEAYDLAKTGLATT
jgi:PAS domain S-box-containing protein